MSDTPGEITTLLSRWSSGDQDAFGHLVTLAYDDLRAIAHRRLAYRAAPGPELSTTGLVHEVFLRLVARDPGDYSWRSRADFYAFASRAMRTILVDHARHANAERRGGGRVILELDEALVPDHDTSADILGVDEAIGRLAERHPRMAQVVELRFFGGFSVSEVADVLNTSVRTVEREWTRAKAYLLEVLEGMNRSG